MTRASAVTVLASVLFAAQAGAFTGIGRDLLERGLVYYRPGALASPDQKEALAMDKTDRLAKAADLFKEAMALATSPRERDQLSKLLCQTWNDLAVEYHVRKDFPRAIEAEQEAIQHAGDGAVTLQLNLGTMYQESGDYYGAAGAFEKAREMTEDPLRLRAIALSLANAYIKDGQTRDKNSYDLAIRSLDDQLGRDAEDIEVLLLMGRVQQLAGQPERALESWGRAKQAGYGGRDFDEAYKRLAASVLVKRDFTKNEGRHFVISFNDAQHSSLADRLLEMFETAFDEIVPTLGGLADLSDKVQVTVYTNAQFDYAVRIAWAGGVHQGNRIDLRVNPRWADEQYADTVRHEFTHHVIDLKAAGKSVPAWLQEGMAMHQERKLDRRAFYHHLSIARKSGGLLPLTALAGSFSQLPGDLVLLAYGESFDFVWYLLEHHGNGQIVKLLEALGQGTPLETAFEGAFRVALPEAERLWRAWLDERATAAAQKRKAAAAALTLRPPARAGSSIAATRLATDRMRLLPAARSGRR